MLLSMDDTHERMQMFEQVLRNFQESLETCMAELARKHEAVDEHWQDAWRKRYDAEYGPLHDSMVRYTQVKGPEYLQFLKDKLQAIDSYLNG